MAKTSRNTGRQARPVRQRAKRGASARRGGWYPVVSFVIIIAAVVFAMSVFFKVSNITVSGNELYTEDEIIAACGIEQGDNLFFVNRSQAVSRIYAKLPYIEQVSIERGLPNRVTITVTESQALAYISLEGDQWTIDRNCKLLGKAEGTEAASLIRVEGIELYAPKVGEIAGATVEDKAKVTYLAEILKQIQSRDLQSYVTQINIETISNPTFDYLGRFTVKLGSDENTEYKFGLLQTAVDSLEAGDYGTIDLSIDKQAHFSAN